MNPYPHHASLGGSPHHPPPGSGSAAAVSSNTGPPGSGGGGGGGGGAEPPSHHGYGQAPNPGQAAAGNGPATTPDHPSPHSPPYGAGPQDGPVPQAYPPHPGQPQGMNSNGHHHAVAAAQAMMQQQQQQQQEQQHRQQQQQQQQQYGQHPHLPPHMTGYPPVNHNNNCTLKEGGSVMSTNIQQCGGCGNRIVDRWLLHALDRYWHNNCLKCTSCGLALAEIGPSCYAKGNMILCKNDYTRLFGNSGCCAACGQTIPATELVTRAGGNVFHTKCFQCTKCGTQLTSGDRYYQLSGAAVCETDFHKMVKSSSVAAAAAAAAATGNGAMPARKGKVGRPRRSRE
ncbi:LIM domain-containing protein B-like isoform X2 [Trichogramma pretiosum]|uniref:LIM domain-containing protein B-like isoform X2 n=1 Tax=Trichogramma pretiosum TaxID=7493 RepID=UPI0006C9A866|nr:LIM domain-containing protein B-like isoform X2 [Trichogramma pretiosum]